MHAQPLELLLIEDSDLDAKLAIKELTDSSSGPFSITRVSRVTEALSQVQGRRFDVVLLDLGLPGTGGLPALEQLRTRIPRETPIVILTGLDDHTTKSRALREGAEDYLSKKGSPGDMRARSIRGAIERNQAKEAFVASEELLALAVDAADLGIFEWNLPSGKMTWSHHLARLLGVDLEEVGSTYDDFERCVHPDDRAGLREKIMGRENFRHEIRAVSADGSMHWLKVRGTAIKNDTCQPPRLIGVVVDISEQKAAEKAWRLTEADQERLSDAKLTARELALLKLVVAGMPSKLIAINLNISVNTVAKHRANLMAKTKARNAADLARMSIQAGIIIDD
jgi:two-component system sensor histidine kinase UhpB